MDAGTRRSETAGAQEGITQSWEQIARGRPGFERNSSVFAVLANYQPLQTLAGYVWVTQIDPETKEFYRWD